MPYMSVTQREQPPRGECYLYHSSLETGLLQRQKQSWGHMLQYMWPFLLISISLALETLLGESSLTRDTGKV